SLNAPARNLTGVTVVVGALIEKQLQLLHELVPGATQVGFLSNPTNPNSATLNNVLAAAAPNLRIKILPLSAVTKGEIEAAFTVGRDQGVGALLIGGDAFLRAQGQQLIETAARYAMATMFDEPEYVAAGGLISYGTRRSEMRRQAGVMSAESSRAQSRATCP